MAAIANVLVRAIIANSLSQFDNDSNLSPLGPFSAAQRLKRPVRELSTKNRDYGPHGDASENVPCIVHFHFDCRHMIKAGEGGTI
jgi:hypothetical protein